MHKTHVMYMEKMHGDKAHMLKSDQTIDDKNLEIMIDTLSGSKQVKVIMKKEKEYLRVFFFE